MLFQVGRVLLVLGSLFGINLLLLEMLLKDLDSIEIGAFYLVIVEVIIQIVVRIDIVHLQGGVLLNGEGLRLTNGLLVLISTTLVGGLLDIVIIVKV